MYLLSKKIQKNTFGYLQKDRRYRDLICIFTKLPIQGFKRRIRLIKDVILMFYDRDKTTAGNGLEIRVPFLTNDLFVHGH